MDSGALGSKLSGAGWGGFCVSLVRKTQLEDFMKRMKTYYTKKRSKD